MVASVLSIATEMTRTHQKVNTYSTDRMAVLSVLYFCLYWNKRICISIIAFID